MRTRHPHPRLAMLPLLVLGVAMTGISPRGRAAEDKVVQLPPFMVEESAGVHWRYAAWPGYEILSVCDDSISMDFVRRVHRLRELLHVLLPDRFCYRTVVPEMNVLLDEDVGRIRSAEIIRKLVRKEGETVDSDGTIRLRNALYPTLTLPGTTRRLATFFPNMHLWDADTSIVVTIRHPDGARRFTLSADRIEYELNRRSPPLPAWFKAGMIALFRRAMIREDDIVIDPAVWTQTSADQSSLDDPDYPWPMVSLRDLFAPQPPRDPDAAREYLVAWQAEAALFVRWGLLAEDGRYRLALWQFADRLDREPVSEAVFRREFGFGLPSAMDRLCDYAAADLRRRTTIPGPKSESLPRVDFRDATVDEIGRIRGEWERLEIPYVRDSLPALIDRYIEQARRTVQHAYELGAKDPRLAAVAGLAECDSGNDAAARPYLEQAVAHEVVHPRAYVELARLRLDAAVGKNQTRRLTPAELREIVGLLLKAREKEPGMPEIYGLLANAFVHSPSPPTPDELGIMNDGVLRIPEQSVYVVRVIGFDTAAGRLGDALAAADAGLASARDAAAQTALKRIRDELRGARPAAP